MRGEILKSEYLSVSEKYIFTCNKEENSLLTFTHEGYLMPKIHISPGIESPSNISAGQDEYFAIADISLNNVVLLQPY